MRRSWLRMSGMLAQEFHITRRSLEVILDLYFFSAVAMLAFGFLTLFLVRSAHGANGAYYLLLGATLWEVVRVTQYSMSVSSLWNVWSHNLSNIFVTPLSLGEYIVTQLIASVAKMLSVVLVIGTVVVVLFHLPLLRLGALNLFLYTLNLTMFAWALGLVLLGFIFRYGTRIQALAWGVVFIFQPLCAAFFPVSLLPRPLQYVADAFPPTHIFEAARANLAVTGTDWSQIAAAFILNLAYLALGLWVFLDLTRRSQVSGQFAKNDL